MWRQWRCEGVGEARLFGVESFWSPTLEPVTNELILKLRTTNHYRTNILTTRQLHTLHDLLESPLIS